MNKLSLIMLLLLLTASVTPVQANDTTTFRATFVKPPCTIVAPATFDLGFIARGKETAYPPFEIQVNCPSQVKMEVYAQHKALGAYDEERLDMIHSSTGGGGNVEFWLEDSAGVRINMKGVTSNIGFCQGTDTRSCQVIPKIRTRQDSITGEQHVVVSFNIRYKA